MRTLHIFRRDLRLEDNTALIEALKHSDSVVPCFIFDDRQIKNNDYFSSNAFQFMIESLEDLDKELRKKSGKLYIFKGIAEEVVEKLIKQEKLSGVYVNGDYTPFSLKRDATLQQVCEKNGATFHQFHDALLNPPGTVLKDDGNPYTVFTPFYRKSIMIPVKNQEKNNHKNYSSESICHSEGKSIFESMLKEKNDQLFVRGGRTKALQIVKHLSDFSKYNTERDFPAIVGTTGLSPHNKFGTISCRELYYAMQESVPETGLIRQLYWRDFFTHIAYHFPHVFGASFQKKYSKIKWINNKKLFDAWCSGSTGFPIIDAGMRELNKTGYMHNRARMIVASFLVKDLHIDWQWGEKYFASKLVDYDPCVNNGSWQWAASTGCDAQPYFRIFNPWLQQKKFDPDCEYIKKWIPELSDVSTKEIHDLEGNVIEGYPEQIVVHSEEKELALAMFKCL